MEAGIDESSAGDATSPWCVMVLAHNEERHIEACLDSIFAAEPGRDMDVYVMANGCSDRTEAIVRSYRSEHPSVHLVSIDLGDKCNAWNVFIHDVVPKYCPDRSVYFFMDGDARIVPGSLSALEQGFIRNPTALAASAPPASGRSMRRDRQELIEGRHLVANLYALSGTCIRRLQSDDVRLPLRLEGDDGLIGILIKWNLRPELDKLDHMLIEPCESAGFTFESVSWRHWREWKGYWRRLVRYGRRRYEFDLLGRRLRSRGIAGLPRDIGELYPDADGLKLRWDGFQTLANWVALRQMRAEGRLRCQGNSV